MHAFLCDAEGFFSPFVVSRMSLVSLSSILSVFGVFLSTRLAFVLRLQYSTVLHFELRSRCATLPLRGPSASAAGHRRVRFHWNINTTVTRARCNLYIITGGYSVCRGRTRPDTRHVSDVRRVSRVSRPTVLT